MSLPQVLAVDLKYDIDQSELEKTINLNLNINKDKFNSLNEQRKESNEREITLQDVQSLIVKGQVKFEDNTFKYVIEPKDDEKELYDLIQPLIEININVFKRDKTELIYLASSFNQLMEQKNYKQITDQFYNPIRKDTMKRKLSIKDYEEIESGKSQYSIVFKTLLNEPLKQVNDIFLPSLNNYKDSLFYNEKESNDSYYKYISYIPENYLWDIPTTMTGENIKVNSIEFKVRYLTMDEISNNRLEYLIENNEEYLNNLNKEIFVENISVDEEKPYELSWSNENLKQTNSLVEINEFPQLLTSDSGEVVITKPEQVKTKLLKLYLGLNHKFFDKKIMVESNNQQVNETS